MMVVPLLGTPPMKTMGTFLSTTSPLPGSLCFPLGKNGKEFSSSSDSDGLSIDDSGADFLVVSEQKALD